MALTNIGCLLDAAVDFELRLETFYTNLRDQSADNNVRLLAYFLSRRRRRLSDIMSSCDPEVVGALRQTDLEKNFSLTTADDFPAIETPAFEVQGKHLLAAAVRYGRSLLKLYGVIVERTDEDLITEMFNSLIKTEKSDIAMLKKMQEMHYFR